MPSLEPESRSWLLSRLRADQSERWQRGDQVRVEAYLGQHPDLAGDGEALMALICCEVLHRLEIGEHPTLDEYLHRFPQHADNLRRLWPVWQLAPEQVPSAGGHSTTTALEGQTAASSGRPPTRLSLPGLELYEQLGEGGMGVVYRARDVRLDQPRAVKIIRRGPFSGQEAQDRFNREAKAAARLDHPGVVRVYALGEHEGILYICMEYLEGGNLHVHLRHGPLEVRAAAELVRRLALAVQHAHEHKVLHRDLKPLNVLLTTEGVPKVADFGLAKLLDADDGLTQTGAVLGTPSYMAPEQAEGRQRDVNEQTDIYALGAILYECLTGRPPFKSDSRSETLELVKTQPPVAVRRLRAEVPAGLEAVCLKCLRKDPGQRYATAAELAAALQDWLDGKPWSPPGARRWRRRPLLAMLGAAVLVGALLPLARRPNGDPTPPPRTAPRWQPGVWHALLDREPRALRWPREGMGAQKAYHPGSRELMLASEGLGLIALGQTTAPRFRLAVRVRQAPWVGNIGLFFGYQDCLVDGRPAQRYQVLEVTSPRSQMEGLLFVDWKSVLHWVPPNGVPQQINTTHRRSASCRMAPGEHVLEMTVGRQGLEAVAWDNVEVLRPVMERLPNPPAPAAYQGQFGIFVSNGNGVFREARYLFHEGP